MADAEALDTIATELLALPIDQFTEQRNQRVRELRAAGDKDLAGAVQQLRRPPLALWAANQLAQHPDALTAVRSATKDAEEAQGRGAASDLRDAMTRLQRALDAAARAAGDLLLEAGHNASDTATLAVREIVRIAALGDDDWERLAAGALMYEPKAEFGFGAVPAPRPSAEREAAPKRPAAKRPAPKAPAPKAPTPKAPAPDEAARDEAARARLREARNRAATDAREAERAAKQAARMRERADDLAERARDAEQRATAAEQEAARAQERATASREAAETLEREQAGEG